MGAPPGHQEGSSDEGEDGGRRVPEAFGAPPEGVPRKEGGKDIAAPLAALQPGRGLSGQHCSSRITRHKDGSLTALALWQAANRTRIATRRVGGGVQKWLVGRVVGTQRTVSGPAR